MNVITEHMVVRDTLMIAGNPEREKERAYPVPGPDGKVLTVTLDGAPTQIWRDSGTGRNIFVNENKEVFVPRMEVKEATYLGLQDLGVVVMIAAPVAAPEILPTMFSVGVLGAEFSLVINTGTNIWTGKDPSTNSRQAVAQGFVYGAEFAASPLVGTSTWALSLYEFRDNTYPPG